MRFLSCLSVSGDAVVESDAFPSERFEMSFLLVFPVDACRTCLVQPGVKMRFLSCLSVSGDAVVESDAFPSERFEMSFFAGLVKFSMRGLFGLWLFAQVYIFILTCNKFEKFCT